MNYVDRPAFAEGQLLAAVDLELTVDYARNALETHDAIAHVPGVVDGMTLALQPNVPPATGKAAFVTPGLAIDRRGRQIAIVTQMPIVTDALQPQPANPYPVYVWSSETALIPAAAFDPCGTVINRVRENANVGVFTDTNAALAAHPDAIGLGYLQWDAAQKAFVDPPATLPHGREGGGVRAHVVVAPEHRVDLGGEDRAASTLAVKSIVKALPSDDGATAPAVQVPGGTVEFSATDGAPAAETVTLSFRTESTTGNALVVGLGNDDPHSQLIVETGSKTVAASIDATGTLTAATGAFENVGASASVSAGSGDNVASLTAVPPANRVGLKASHTLPLAFGTAPGDEAMFISGANPVATVDAHAVTHSEHAVALGTIDAANGIAGLATMLTDVLSLCAMQNDIILRPGNAPLLRLTPDGKVLNANLGACDVTPETFLPGGNAFLLRLGTLAVAFGTLTVSVFPIADAPPTIVFPRPFVSAPAFFVSAYITGRFTLGAAPTSVTNAQATFKIVRHNPANPNDGDTVAWSNTKANNARVSWAALGVMG